MESDTIESSGQKTSSPLKTIITLVIVIVIGVWLFGKIQDAIRPKSWTLFVYSSKNPDMNYLLNRADNLTKDSCITTGLAYTKDFGSYECGYDCKFSNKYLTETCAKTCDHGGCRD